MIIGVNCSEILKNSMPNDKNGGLNGSRNTCCRQEPEKRTFYCNACLSSYKVVEFLCFLLLSEVLSAVHFIQYSVVKKGSLC